MSRFFLIKLIIITFILSLMFSIVIAQTPQALKELVKINPTSKLFIENQSQLHEEAFVANPEVTPITLKIKVFLDGPYIFGSNPPEMKGEYYPEYLGVIDDYSSPSRGPFKHPPGSIDWVGIEFRRNPYDSAPPLIIGAILTQYGDIVAAVPDGVTKPFQIDRDELDPDYDSYYIVVKHHNHLDIMTANPVFINSDSVSYDFTTGQDRAWIYPPGDPRRQEPLKQLDDGVYGMVAGDAFHEEGQQLYQIDSLDFDRVQRSHGATGRHPADVTLDAIVNYTDLYKTDYNSTMFPPYPRYCQVPY